MKTLRKFKNASNVHVLFVFRQVSVALAMEKVPSKASVHLTFPVEQVILKPRHYRLWNQEAP